MDNLLIDKNVKIQHTYCYQYSKSKEFSLKKKKIKCNNLLKYLSLNFVQSFLSPLPLNQNKKKQKNLYAILSLWLDLWIKSFS